MTRSCGCSFSDGSIESNKVQFNILKNVLETWNEDGRLFTQINLYKSRLNGCCGAPSTPNVCGIAHHQGVVMAHAGKGSQPRYLKLDFGKDGLDIEMKDCFPDIQGLVNWSDQMYRFSEIAPQHGRPKRLLDLLEKLQGIGYHILKWNCKSFAAVMWQYFVPQDVVCVPDPIFPMLLADGDSESTSSIPPKHDDKVGDDGDVSTKASLSPSEPANNGGKSSCSLM